MKCKQKNAADLLHNICLSIDRCEGGTRDFNYLVPQIELESFQCFDAIDIHDSWGRDHMEAFCIFQRSCDRRFSVANNMLVIVSILIAALTLLPSVISHVCVNASTFNFQEEQEL